MKESLRVRIKIFWNGMPGLSRVRVVSPPENFDWDWLRWALRERGERIPKWALEERGKPSSPPIVNWVWEGKEDWSVIEPKLVTVEGREGWIAWKVDVPCHTLSGGMICQTLKEKLDGPTRSCMIEEAWEDLTLKMEEL